MVGERELWLLLSFPSPFLTFLGHINIEIQFEKSIKTFENIKFFWKSWHAFLHEVKPIFSLTPKLSSKSQRHISIKQLYKYSKTLFIREQRKTVIKYRPEINKYKTFSRHRQTKATRFQYGAGVWVQVDNY